MVSMVKKLAQALGFAAGQDDPYHGVVRQLAERLQTQERVAGGWATEVGVLPPEAFEDEAEQLVQSIALGGNQGGAPTP